MKRKRYEQIFNSHLSIDDNVTFIPSAYYIDEYKIKREEMFGKIIAVRFSKAKVFYDIIDDYYSYLFKNIDSILVEKDNR
jgi:hypothetical protein